DGAVGLDADAVGARLGVGRDSDDVERAGWREDVLISGLADGYDALCVFGGDAPLLSLFVVDVGLGDEWDAVGCKRDSARVNEEKVGLVSGVFGQEEIARESALLDKGRAEPVGRGAEGIKVIVGGPDVQDGVGSGEM